MVELDVLPGSDVAFIQRGVLFGHRSQGVQGIGGEDAAGDFDPDHLDVGLALTVNPLTQPERRKLGVIYLSRLKPGRLAFKPDHLLFHEGDDARRVRRQVHTFLVNLFLVYSWDSGAAGQLGLLKSGKNKTPTRW